MLRAALLALAVAACGRAQGVSDEELGGLVVPVVGEDARKIDVALAAKDPAELGRALAQPHHKVLAALGPHVVKIASSSALPGESPLTDNVVLEAGAQGAFHGVYTNNADYGRETIFVDGKLYLRPRYQRWHGRNPDFEGEPQKLRDGYFEAVFATWDLLAPAAELVDKGPVQVAGRTGRKIQIAAAPKPRANPEERLAQRRWRQSRTIEGVTGEVVLDANTGVMLAAKLAGTVGFQKDGKRYAMKVSVDAAVSDVGTPVAIAAPAAGEVVATPERLREVDDRDFLLQNIAPPIRRNPDGTAATPEPKKPAAAAGSAAPSKPDRKSESK